MYDILTFAQHLPKKTPTTHGMTNKQIANAFDDLANILELHEENEFKIKSYRNAYITLRKLDRPLSELPEAEVKAIKGIGPAISARIQELLQTGTMQALEEARAKTPPGVVEMLEINGFGPKKVRSVWQDMGIESIGELWYACNENRLVEYKGFGLKTQEDLRQRLEYHQRSKGFLHCDAAEAIAQQVCAVIAERVPGAFIAPVGEVRRKCPVVRHIEILVGYNGELTAAFQEPLSLVPSAETSHIFKVNTADGAEATIFQCLAEEFGSKLFQYSGSPEFVSDFVATNTGVSFKSLRMEQDIFEKANLPYVVPELRDHPQAMTLAKDNKLPELVTAEDLKGVLHVHTTWSDGLHTLEQMCTRAQELGYRYIGITDHSKAAFYANGLQPDRLLAQWDAIDQLNEKMKDFRILKGIESDILNDGSLDYDDNLLDRFDFVIASVHTNLKMGIEKATERVVRAIEHPATTILGHPTGRLLLSREGYPLDWEVVFDACKRCKVAIELNAHPYRLDIDYTLIPRALELGIPISINPDAHSLDGLEHVRYGLQIARKGGLTAATCFNAQMPDQWPKN
jgi:DNA polymerase (family X)